MLHLQELSGEQLPIGYGGAVASYFRRLQCRRGLQVGEGVLILAKVVLGKTPVGVGIGIVWLEFESPILVGDGVQVPAEVKIGIAAMEVGEGSVRLMKETLVIVSYGVLVMTQTSHCKSPIEVGIGMVGL